MVFASPRHYMLLSTAAAVATIVVARLARSPFPGLVAGIAVLIWLGGGA